MSNGPWTDAENDLIVADYFAMLADDITGRRYSKAEHRRALLPLLNDLRAVRGGRATTVARAEFLIPGPRTFGGVEKLSRWLHPAAWAGEAA